MARLVRLLVCSAVIPTLFLLAAIGSAFADTVEHENLFQNGSGGGNTSPGSPAIEVNPSEFRVALVRGESREEQLTITNSGDSDLQYQAHIDQPLESKLRWTELGQSELTTRITQLTVDPVTGILYALFDLGGDEGRAFKSYDPNTDTWVELPSCPLPFDYLGGVCFLNGKVYAASHANPLSGIAVFDVAAGEWSIIPNDTNVYVSLLGTDGNYIYATGSPTPPLSGAFGLRPLSFQEPCFFARYSPFEDAWEILPDPPEPIGQWGGIGFYDGRLYVVSQGYESNSSFYSFDLANFEWSEHLPPPSGTTQGLAVFPEIQGLVCFRYGALQFFDIRLNNSWRTAYLDGLRESAFARGMAYSPVPSPRVYIAASDGLGYVHAVEGEWLWLDHDSGTVGPGESDVISVTLDTTQIPSDGGGYVPESPDARRAVFGLSSRTSQRIGPNDSPRQLGSRTYLSNILIESNDPDDGWVNIPVWLTLLQPTIHVEPDELNFGVVWPGETVVETLTISNNGDVPLEVTNITWGSGSISASPLNLLVDPGSSQEVEVSYSPTDPGELDDVLIIESNDPDSPTVNVRLLGSSPASGPRVVVEPTTLDKTVEAGATGQDQLTITNIGDADLIYTIGIEYDHASGSPVLPGGALFTPASTSGSGGFTTFGGGPDTGGYRWKSSAEPGGPVYNWIDISSTGTSVSDLGDDRWRGPFPIGFPFTFYGNTYTQFYISSNGYIGFGPPYGYDFYWSTALPNASAPNNCIYWNLADLYQRPYSYVHYETRSEGLVVQFTNYGWYGWGAAVTAEIVLRRGGDILLQYQTTDTSRECVIGIEDATGTAGLDVNAADRRMPAPGTAIRFYRYDWLSTNPTIGTIPPGESQTLDVIYNAADLVEGDYQGRIQINSNDPATPKIVPVTLRVVGIPDIAINPAAIDFGSVFVGFPWTRQMTIKNNGTGRLNLQIASSNAELSAPASLTVAPHSETTVAVTWTPTAVSQLDGSNLTITSNDPDTPTIVVPLTGSAVLPPVADVDPASLTQSLELGTTAQQIVNLTNTGHSTLTFQVTTLAGWVSVAPNSGQVEPGTTLQLTVIFNAAGVGLGSYNTLIRISSNDPAHPTIDVPVAMEVWGLPRLVVAPSTVDFGTVFVNTTGTRQLTISNNRTAVLNVSSIMSDVETVTVNPTQFSVNPGQNRIVTVQYSPTQIETLSANLTITSNDPDNPTFVVPVVGEAGNPPVVTVDPDNLHGEVEAGEIAHGSLTIGNEGSNDLQYTIQVDYEPSGSGGGSPVPMSVFGFEQDSERPALFGDLPWASDSQSWVPQGGGPDAGGYRWESNADPGGPVYNWIDIRSTGTPVWGLGDDSYQGPFPIGFPFTFYGNTYTQFYISSNGFIGFGPPDGYSRYSFSSLPNINAPNNCIYWGWADLYQRWYSYVHYETRAEGLVVQFTNYDWYASGGLPITAEVILSRNGNILLQYQSTDVNRRCTVGIENATGTVGLDVNAVSRMMPAPGTAIRLHRYNWLSTNPTSGTIPPGESQTLDVIYNAADLVEGDYEGRIKVHSNDPVTPVKIVPVTLHVGGIPRIATSPVSLDFGATLLGDVVERTLSVSNPGTSSLVVSGIVCDNAQITVTPTTFTLPPGGAQNVTVRYAPTQVGAFTANLTITSNAENAPQLNVPLTGQALDLTSAYVYYAYNPNSQGTCLLYTS
ncbi:MAG: choice-of-anchor D domain-containing protein, partial [Armatimonadetes bacterium]|nr:choice-of-anchor D domain-containing protein [Armatimonadota bacterium]